MSSVPGRNPSAAEIFSVAAGGGRLEWRFDMGMESSAGYAGLHAARDVDGSVAPVLLRHGYYVMAVAEASAVDGSATGRTRSDFNDYTMFCMAPSLVGGMSYSLSGVVPRRWLLMTACTPSSVPMTPPKGAYGYTFFGYAPREALHLSSAEYDVLSECVDDMCRELPHEEDRYKRSILSRHAIRMMDYIGRFYERQFAVREVACCDMSARYTALVDDYIWSGRLCRDGIPSAAACAAALGMSEAYMRDMLRFVTGHTHEYLVAARRIDAARRMLSSHCLSVGKIAEQLAFASEDSFRFIYKRMTGLAPEQSAAEA